MFSVCFGVNSETAKIIESASRAIDSRGRFNCVNSYEELQTLMSESRPDVVWACASEENYALVADPVIAERNINWIFVSEDVKHAGEAFRVRASGFVLEPVDQETAASEIRNLRYPVQQSVQLRIQCFGNFEVMCNGTPMRFTRSLGKEALAYLIDRRGAACTISEICNTLWENRVADKSLKSQCRMIMSSLKRDLEAAGAADILVKQWNTWAVNTERVYCDYYDFLKKGKKSAEKFRGEYMAQYSWAELTSGNLYQFTK
jgi:two-component SAPR family response regulator